jgi:protein-S-isoprenylcysteine O-methyltransferase Ste14
MSEAALWLMGAYLVLAFGLRVGVQLRRTGASGVVAPAAMPFPELLAGGVFLAAIALGALNPLLAQLDAIAPSSSLDRGWIQALGLVLCGAGIAGTFASQMAMGASWRIGVDPDERTELVTSGLFSLSRNPIYVFMFCAWAGFALLVPTWLAAVSLALLSLGLELQVRLVEEPHLLRAHGEAYRRYAQRVGRFLPGIGRRPGVGPG